MVGKNVGVRLNKEELEEMQKIADKEDTTVGKLVKKAMKNIYLDKSVEIVPIAEVSERMKEKMKASKESEHWNDAMRTLMEMFYSFGNRFSDPEFVRWIGEMNDVLIYEGTGLWEHYPPWFQFSGPGHKE